MALSSKEYLKSYLEKCWDKSDHVFYHLDTLQHDYRTKDRADEAWYALHRIVWNPSKWSFKMLAYGFHIKVADVVQLQSDYVRQIAELLEKGEPWSADEQYYWNELYEDLESRLLTISTARVPRYWRLEALPRLVQAFTQHTSAALEQQPALLNLPAPDCDLSKFFHDIVDDAFELLSAMQSCRAILSGSRAATVFWPSASVRASDWDFYIPNDAASILSFASYLASKGVSWYSSPERLATSKGTASDGLYSAVSGSLQRNGAEQKVQIVYTISQSSLHSIARFHSTIVQCFVASFGAICIYPELTLLGKSLAWTGNKAAEKARRKYARRGITYVQTEPDDETWTLADSRVMRICWTEKYEDASRRECAEEDLATLQQCFWEQKKKPKTFLSPEAQLTEVTIHDLTQPARPKLDLPAGRTGMSAAWMSQVECSACQDFDFCTKHCEQFGDIVEVALRLKRRRLYDEVGDHDCFVI